MSSACPPAHVDGTVICPLPTAALHVAKRTDSLPTVLDYPLSDDIESAPSSEPPDGGVQAWATVFGAFIALFCTFGHLSSFGTYQSWYETNQFQRLLPSAIAWIGSLQLFIFFLSGAPIGRVFDAYGPLCLMTSGSVVLVTSIVVTSIATEYYQFILSQGVFFSLGVGMLFYPSLACISTHFSRYRATALGLATSGSSVGGVVYPIMLRRLFGSLGFGWALRVSALVTSLCCVLAIATVTRRSRHRRSTSTSTTPAAVAPWIDPATFKDARFSLLCAGCFFVASGKSGLFVPFFYITDYARDHGIPHVYLLAVMNLGSVPGRIAPARLADAIGHFALLAPAAFLSGLSCLALWLPSGVGSSPYSLLVAFAAVYGFCSGAFVAVLTSCIARITDVRVIGTRIGMLYSIISLPSLLGGPIAGVLLVRMNGSYTGMIVFSGTGVIVGSLFILLAKLQVDPRVLARV